MLGGKLELSGKDLLRMTDVPSAGTAAWISAAVP